VAVSEFDIFSRNMNNPAERFADRRKRYEFSRSNADTAPWDAASLDRTAELSA
jgi:hypothetical protein